MTKTARWGSEPTTKHQTGPAWLHVFADKEIEDTRIFLRRVIEQQRESCDNHP